jgi:hypothetical protein
MIRTRLVGLPILGGAMTSALTVVWALAYAAGAGVDAGDIPLAPILLGPAAGVLTVLAAARLSGHPADPASDTSHDNATTPEPSHAVPASGR